jgi:hypothetical protein
MWWLDVAVLPFNLTAIAVLVLCIRRHNGQGSGPYETTGNVSEV